MAEANYGPPSTHTLTPRQTSDLDVEKGLAKAETMVSIPSELFEKVFAGPIGNPNAARPLDRIC